MTAASRKSLAFELSKRGLAAAVIIALSSCAPIVNQSQSSGPKAPARISSSGQHMITNGELLVRIRAIRAERTRQAAIGPQREIFGVKVPSITTLSFSHIARGLQTSDQPLDAPPVPLPDFASAAEQPSPIEQILAEAPDAILDERAAKLLEEAERTDSTILDDSVPLSELARGSLSPEAFQKISTEIQTAKTSKRAVVVAVGTCVLCLCICGFFVFKHIIEELRMRHLPAFGRRLGDE